MKLLHLVRHMSIAIQPDELIVGNRSLLPRMGVIAPEGAVDWVDRELEVLPTRPQDRFNIRPEQIPHAAAQFALGYKSIRSLSEQTAGQGQDPKSRPWPAGGGIRAANSWAGSWIASCLVVPSVLEALGTITPTGTER